MLRLFFVATLAVAAVAPAFACEFNKSDAAGSSATVSQSHSSKPARG
jgi:hypothetical protein